VDILYKTALETMLQYANESFNVSAEDKQRLQGALDGAEEPREIFRDFVKDAGIHQRALGHYAESAMEGRHSSEHCVWPDCPAKSFPYAGSPPSGHVHGMPQSARSNDEKAAG
jgi:hypothetical protein